MDNGTNSSMSWQAALDRMHEYNLSAALEILLETVGYEPENLTLINLLADCYYYLGEFDRAKACWDEVLRLNSANQEAKNKIGRYRTPSFQSWLKRYKLALYNIEQKNYESALKMLRELLEENDGFVSVYQFLGLCYMALGEYEQARLVWKKGLEKDTGNKTLSDYLHLIPSASSIQVPQTVREEPGEEPEAKLGEESGAKPGKRIVIFRFRAVYALAATACLLLLIKAVILPGLGSSPEAQYGQEEAVVNEMTVAAAEAEAPVLSAELRAEELSSRGGSDYDLEGEKSYYRAGYQAYQARNFTQAISNLGVVAAMDSGNYLNREALYYLARTYYLQKDYEQAEYHYLQYLDKFPETNYCDDSLFYLGVVYQATGQTEKSIQALEEMRRISPGCGYESSKFFQTMMEGR
jgi:tetratricopeptide (TPR) repeat protein